jgi:hypothetical protein
MIFVFPKAGEKKSQDELKLSIFRYFKYLPQDRENYSKIISGFGDCLLIDMPPRFGAIDHLRQTIKPEIEFFYQLCNPANSEPSPKKRKVVLLSAQDFDLILKNVQKPPCYIKVPFSMEHLFEGKLVADGHCCETCEWGKKLTKYRNILYHCGQIEKVYLADSRDTAKQPRDAIKIIEEYQDKDFIAEVDEIANTASKVFSITNKEKQYLANIQVYLLEDRQDDQAAIRNVLIEQGFDKAKVRSFSTSKEFIDRIITKGEEAIRETNSIVLLDLILEGDIKQGEGVCKNINWYRPFLPIFIISRKEDLFELVNGLVGLRIEGFFSKQTVICETIDGDVKGLYTRFLVSQVISAVEKAKTERDDRIYIESQKRRDDQVGIVVAGYGKFSQQTFDNILKLIRDSDRYELLGIVEPEWQARQAAEERLRKENLDTPRVVRDFDELRNFIYKYPGKIFIRDASSSDHHAKNYDKCYSSLPHFFHFVEKPMALSHTELDKYRPEHPFSCNLSEIENPAVLTIKEYIRENALHITNMEFWRYCSMAWIQLLGGERIGVRGGSYMDKAIHDWSVAYFLLSDHLSSYDIKNPIGREIVEVSIELFMPFSCNNLLKPYPDHLLYKNVLENGDNGEKVNHTPDLKEAEDLKMNSKVYLTLDGGKQIEIEMNSSWGGITRTDKEKILMLKDKSTLQGALYTKERFGTVDFEVRRNVDYKFLEQELRLGKIEATRSDGETTKIYFNMLERKQAGIYPFVKVVTGKGLQSIPLCGREATPFDRILDDSLSYCTCSITKPKTGPEMSIFCHDMALSCLEKARGNIEDRNDAEAAIADVHKHLKEVGVTFYFD